MRRRSRRRRRRRTAQLDLANALYRTNMHLATVAAYAGVSMIVEHPATATWKPQAASSWGLPETRALARHPDVCFITIDQGAYVADARKATTPMLADLPELAAAVQQTPHMGPGPQHQAYITALGRIEGTPEYQTAHLKKYPPALCKLMADSDMQDWRGLLSQLSAAPLPAEWRASYCTDMTAAMGADCARKPLRLRTPLAARGEETACSQASPASSHP